MSRTSAGILLYRRQEQRLEVFLVHPGGPFWKGKEKGAWSIPKGEFTEKEDPLAAALREFEEETGTPLNANEYLPLQSVKQKAGKTVQAWAVEGNVDADKIKSNSFRQEWPYKSGKWVSFPEVDKAAWFGVEEALEMINPAQAAFVRELISILEG
jgi:predicted NUDIX family NTP pyrophosphohydrolase